MEKLPFIPGQEYNRSQDIHAKYGGNPRSGISSSAQSPYIFIFTGKSGKQHGYEDRWVNKDVFTYTGEGQVGDMVFNRGNLALRDHLLNGKRLLLFEALKKGKATFIAELEYFDFGYFPAKDRNGDDRTGIKFFLKRKGINLPLQFKTFTEESLLSEPPISNDFQPPNKTQRQGLVTSRVGQGAYRKSIILRWEYQCAVSGFNNLRILIASHILPWSKATDQQRLDVDNGLLLAPNYDALFDKHLISFENNGKIILSDTIEKQAYAKLGVTGNERIQKLSSYNHVYLDHHRERFGNL